MAKGKHNKVALIFIPLFLATFLIGSGFSLWIFNNGRDVEDEDSVNVTTTGIKDIGSFYRNFDANSYEEDTSGKRNFLVVDETSVNFLYNYYIHLDFNDPLPSAGTLSFTYDIRFETIKVQLDETLFPSSTYGWPYDGYLSLSEMLVLYIKPMDSSTWSKVESFPTTENGLNSDGYYSQTIKLTNQTWHSSISLAANQALAGTSICMASTDNIDINYKTTYLEYSEEQKEEILKKARILLGNTTISINYNISYSS